jgi:hypothetical protein
MNAIATAAGNRHACLNMIDLDDSRRAAKSEDSILAQPRGFHKQDATVCRDG